MQLQRQIAIANISVFITATVHLAFLSLFPGFFLYHTALGSGLIGPVLGGFFSPVALAFLPVLVCIYLYRIRQNKRFFNRTDLVFLGFILYFFFTVALNFSLGAHGAVVQNHLVAMSHLVAVFIVFRLAVFHAERMRLAVLACLLGMTAIIFFMSIDGLFYLKQSGDAGDSESLATYQGFARSYLVTFLVATPFVRPAALRIPLYGMAVPALFLNGARSELSAVIALIPLIEIYHARHRLAVICLAMGAALLVIFFADAIIAQLPVNRSLEILDLANSDSWESRDFLFSHALATIAAHPFLGDYGSYVEIFGNAGSNAHNIFSAWVDLGLPGFLFVLCMTCVPMGCLTADYVCLPARQRTDQLLLAFGLMFVTLLLLLTAKSFTYVLLGAAMGYYASCRQENVIPRAARGAGVLATSGTRAAAG